MRFAPVWFALLAQPTLPPYDPRAQHTYEGLVPGSRTTRGLAAVTRTAPPAAAIADNATAADPVEAPCAASNFRQPMGVLHAQVCSISEGVCVCVCVCVCVYLRVFDFSDASFETFGLLLKFFDRRRKN